MLGYRDRDIFEEAKSRSLTDFLEKALLVSAHKVGSQIRMDSCPNCGPSAADSAKLRIRDDRTWQCYGCGEHGSIIDAAMHAYKSGWTALEAAYFVVEGVTTPAQSPGDIRAKQQEQSERKNYEVKALGLIYEATRAEFNSRVWDYLVGTRGLSPQVVQSAWEQGMLGTMPADREQAGIFLRRVVGDDLLFYAGLWKEDAPLPWIANRPLIQFVESHEFAEFRIIYKPNNPKTKKSLAVGKPGTPYFWYGQDPSRCLVTEGCLELLAARSMGYHASCVSAAGTGSWNISWFKGLHSTGVEVFDLAFNNDDHKSEDGTPHNPGQEAQAELATELDQLGFTWNDASPREPGDINDMLLKKRGNYR